MKDLGGRVAIVTGASRGLGSYIAWALADRGMNVVMAARDGAQLEAVRKQLRSDKTTLAVVADVTREEDRQALLDAAVNRFGDVDVLVNNAGTDHPGAFVDDDFERIRAMIELNVLAPLRLTQIVLPWMLERGKGQIVNISSMAGLSPVPYSTTYSTTKHAIQGFTESLRYELEGSGVGVSGVYPYYVREAGLFHDNAGGNKKIVQTVSPEQVATAVVAAIVNNRARVMVSPRLAKLAPVLRGISPDFFFGMARRQGAVKVMQTLAEGVREREAATEPGGSTRWGRPRPKKGVARKAVAKKAVATKAVAKKAAAKQPARSKPARTAPARPARRPQRPR